MRINEEQQTMDMEARDVNYILPAYVRSYLFYTRNTDPKEIVFPMFESIPHPHKKGVSIPIRWVPPLGPEAIEIAQDGGNVPEATEEQIAEADTKDEEIKRLKAKLAQYEPELQGEEGLPAVDEKPEEPEVAPEELEPKEPAFTIGDNPPPPDRVPKQPDHPASGSPDDMGSRDARADKQIKKDLKLGEDEPDGSKEKHVKGKKMSKDESGNIKVEDEPDAAGGQ